MNLLDSITEKHPVLSVFTGSSATIVSWFFANIETLTGIERFLIGLFGLVTAVLTFLMMLRRWRRDLREEQRKRFWIERDRVQYEDDQLP